LIRVDDAGERILERMSREVETGSHGFFEGPWAEAREPMPGHRQNDGSIAAICRKLR
jgi:hypothetical protein